MTASKRNKPAQGLAFHLEKITTEQFALVANPPGENADIEIGAQFKFGFIPEEYAIVCGFNYQMGVDDKPFLLLEVACLFILQKSSWDSLIHGQTLLLSRGLAVHLGVITAATTRGVLHGKTEHTGYNDYPMPLINIEDLLPEDIQYEL